MVEADLKGKVVVFESETHKEPVLQKDATKRVGRFENRSALRQEITRPVRQNRGQSNP